MRSIVPASGGVVYSRTLILLAVLALLIFVQAGLLLLWFVRDERAPLSRPESLSAAFGFGVGLITFQMLLMGLASIPLRLPVLLAPWAVAWTIVAVRARGRLIGLFGQRAMRAQERLTLVQEVVASTLLCLLVVLVLLLLYRASVFPLLGWDAWAIWDLKARAFWHDGGIKPFLGDTYYALAHQDYPLLYPLAGTLLYLVVGTPHHIVQLIPVTFYVCLLVQYASALRRLGASHVWTLALTCGLACVPPLLYVGQEFFSENALVYYLLTSTVYLVLYLREERASFLWLSAFAAGFMTQVRPEGVLLLIAPLGILALRAVTRPAGPGRRQAAIACGLYAGIVLAIFLPWAIASRFLTAAEGRLISSSYLAGFLTNGSIVARVVATTVEWTMGLRYLGPFTILAPVAAVLVVWQWRRWFGEWAHACLLVVVVWSYAPYLAFLIARPEWLYVGSMGRYLVAPTVMLYFFVTSESAFLRFGRVALAAGGVGLILWLGTDLLGWQPPSPTYEIRPVETARTILSEGDTLARLTPLQRLQRVEFGNTRLPFSAMLPELVAAPLPDGDVILFRSPKDADAAWGSYLSQRLYYLLYPRKVRVVDDEAQLRRALATSPVAALIVYDQLPPLDIVDGDALFRYELRYAVIRGPRLRRS